MKRPVDIPAPVWEHAELLMDALRHVEDDRELIARVLMADRQRRGTRAGLTPKQNKTLNFIGAYIDQHGYSPTFAEIAESIGVASRGRAHLIVGSLIERGALATLPGKTRALQIVAGSHS